MRYKVDDRGNIIITRKCFCCGSTVYIDHKNIDEAIYYDKKTYHSNCFIQTHQNRVNRAKSETQQKQKSKEVLQNIDAIKDGSHHHFEDMITRYELTEFIYRSYDVTVVPSTVWTRIEEVFNGTYKFLLVKIPPTHLLDMWKRKMNSLNKIADKNNTKGKKIEKSKRIIYDLAILINKYDSYLDWLEKQKILEAEKNLSMEKLIISREIISEKAKDNNTNKEDNDMSDLVDDIFND